MQLSNRFTNLAAAAAALFASALPAAAITDSKFQYSTDQLGFYSISPMDMSPDGSNTAAKSWFSSWYGAALTGDGCFQTGVHLPTGAKIVEVRVWYTKSAHVDFYETKLADGSSNDVVSESYGDGTGTTRASGTTTLAVPVTVDNRNLLYGFGVCLDPGEVFQGARFYYKYNTAGD